MQNERYSKFFDLTAFGLVIALALVFTIAVVLGLTGLALAAACVLGGISLWGLLWSIPATLLLILIGEMADERAASNDSRIERAWARNHRTITAFLACRS